MRTILPACLAVLALAAPADAATRNFGITDFTKSAWRGHIKVKLATGVAPFARAAARPPRSIGSPSKCAATRWWSSRMRRGAAIRAAILGRSRSASARTSSTRAWLIGSGAVAIDRVKGAELRADRAGIGRRRDWRRRVDQMNISLEGTASARSPGKTGKLAALVRGVSALDAAALSTRRGHRRRRRGDDRCRSHRHRDDRRRGARRPSA